MKIYTKIKNIILSIWIILVTAFILIGCSAGVQIKQAQPEVVIVKDEVEKIVVEKCEVPNNLCSFEGEGFVPTEKLLECIIIQKKYLDICSGKVK